MKSCGANLYVFTYSEMHGVKKKYLELEGHLLRHEIHLRMYSKLGKINKLHIFFRGLQISLRQTAVIRHIFMDPILFINIIVSKLLFGRKTILEHHSDHRAELRKRGQLGKFLVHVDLLITKLVDRWIDGHISVSHAVAQRQAAYFKHGNRIVIENGSSIAPTKTEVILKHQSEPVSSLKLVMIASSFCQWHGLERLISKLGGSSRVEVTLVGNLGYYQETKLPRNFNAVGLILDSQQFQGILSEADIAVDSLNLSAIGLTESSSLKSREYMMKCKPIICEYLPTPDWCKYSLKFEDFKDEKQLIQWYNDLDLSEIQFVAERLFNERYSHASVATRYKKFIVDIESEKK